jgi:hypothetical protein
MLHTRQHPIDHLLSSIHLRIVFNLSPLSEVNETARGQKWCFDLCLEDIDGIHQSLLRQVTLECDASQTLGNIDGIHQSVPKQMTLECDASWAKVW